MGGGDFGGNGSVVWNVHHGSKGAPTGPVLGSGAGDPGNNEVKVGPNARGKDAIQTPASFTVTLRFPSTTTANNAWATRTTAAAAGGDVLVSLQVPAIARPNRVASPPLEVQVEW